MRWLPSSPRARRLEAMRPGACRFFCVCGLEVGGGPVGVGGGGFVLGFVLRLVVWPWCGAGWGGWSAGGFALSFATLLGALVAVAGLVAAVVRLRSCRRRVVAAALGHLAQLVARGLDRVGGGGASGAGGEARRGAPWVGALGMARTGLGPFQRRRRLGVAGPGSDSAKSSKAPAAASPPSAVWTSPPATVFLVVPCRGRTVWRGGSGGTRADSWAMDWGQTATGSLRGGPEGPSYSPTGGAPWWSARGHGHGSRPGVDHGEGKAPLRGPRAVR